MNLAAVGERIGELRRLRGLSQRQLAQMSGVDHGYLSRVERGLRRPGDSVLNGLARALGCPVDHLSAGEPWYGHPQTMDLELNFAELALRSGDAAAARIRYEDLLARARDSDDDERAALSLLGLSLALDALGELHEAAEGLAELAEMPTLPSAIDRVRLLMMLCRTSMLVGDVNRGIDVGEAALREAGWGSEPASESVIELASTLSYCYYERGDLARAQYLMTKVLTRAEEHGSVRARASAYWNAAYVAQGNGDVRSAIALTERALALFGELENAWATATLRRNAGWLMLQLPDPPLTEIRPLLERARAELHEVGGPGDIAEVEIDLAQLHLDLGNEATALQFANSAVDRTVDGPTPEAARARLMLADVLVASGDITRALAMYRDAAMDFETASVTRLAAISWRRLADLLVSLGRHEEAIDAYARLADVTGVPQLTPASQRVRHRNFGY